jgi:hypothetical protein
VTVWIQVLLLALHAGLLLAASGLALRRLGRGAAARGCFFTAAALTIAAGVGFAAEAARMYEVARATDWQRIERISTSLANYGMFQHDAGPLLAGAHYIGGVLCRSVLPVTLLGLALGLFYLRHMARRRGRPAPPPLQAAALLFCAIAGTQARGLFTYSAYGTFELLLPLLLDLGPHLLASPRLALPRVAWVRVWRARCAALLLLFNLGLAGGLYAYEFRDARWAPVRLETAYGTLRLPRTARAQALADTVRFVRAQGLRNVLSVPYDGIQLWTGSPAEPYWPGLLLADIYRPPWSAQLDAALERGDLTFVYMPELDVSAVTFPTAETDWVDGPVYTPYRWKERFPRLWRAMSQESRLLASFGPRDKPFFVVYRQELPAAAGGSAPR